MFVLDYSGGILDRSSPLRLHPGMSDKLLADCSSIHIHIYYDSMVDFQDACRCWIIFNQ